MIKLLLKHKLLEYMIDVIYNQIDNNFPTMNGSILILKGYEINYSHVGMKVIKVDNNDPFYIHPTSTIVDFPISPKAQSIFGTYCHNGVSIHNTYKGGGIREDWNGIYEDAIYTLQSCKRK